MKPEEVCSWKAGAGVETEMRGDFFREEWRAAMCFRTVDSVL